MKMRYRERLIRWIVQRWLPKLLVAETHVPELETMLEAQTATIATLLARVRTVGNEACAALLTLNTERTAHEQERESYTQQRNVAIATAARLEDQVARAQLDLATHIAATDAAKLAEQVRVMRAHEAEVEGRRLARDAASHALHDAMRRVGLNPDDYVGYYDVSASGRLNELLYYGMAYLGGGHPLRTLADLEEFFAEVYWKLLTPSAQGGTHG